LIIYIIIEKLNIRLLTSSTSHGDIVDDVELVVVVVLAGDKVVVLHLY
jgi:hypothetical protein